MKALLATTALAAIVLTGSPVTAQIVYDQEAAGAFAQAPSQARPTVQPRNPAFVNRNPDGRPHSSNPAYDVYDTSGQYVGSDPDVAIRNDLMRDPPNRGD